MPIDDKYLEQLEELRRAYLADRRLDATAMRTLVAGGRFDDVTRLSHRMRGSGATYGFAEVSVLGGNLESAAIANDAGRVNALLDNLDKWLTDAQGHATNEGDS